MFFDVKKLKRCLFIDVETVSEFPDYDALPDNFKRLWDIKSQQIGSLPKLIDDEISPESLYVKKAGIYAEFSKIVCISMGFLSFGDEDLPTKVRMKSLAGDDEKKLLADFTDVLNQHYSDPDNSFISGHNVKEFDIPFICRRLVINQLPFPEMLDISGKKPWQTQHILDTMDMWRFGDYKNYTSLVLLAGALGIPSPKDDIDGSQVGDVYWKAQDIDRIKTYCQKDVFTVIQIMLRYAGCCLLSEDVIEYVE